MLISLGWAVWETLVQVKSLFNLFFGACVSVLRTLNSSKYKRLISLLHFIPFPLCQTWQHLGPRHHPGHPLATPAARLRGCAAAWLRGCACGAEAVSLDSIDHAVASVSLSKDVGSPILIKTLNKWTISKYSFPFLWVCLFPIVDVIRLPSTSYMGTPTSHLLARWAALHTLRLSKCLDSVRVFVGAKNLSEQMLSAA